MEEKSPKIGSSIDPAGVTFVNAVVGIGVRNGVANIQFGTLLFDQDGEGVVDLMTLAVSCRLRMDVVCAAQLRDLLIKMFPPAPAAATTDAASETVN